ncbi:hypothetical protein A5790_14575 [Mycobacterium sp. 852002-51152_SCH6134967]|uniref:Panacea domain-containing protein n=1 Tax=Mycobacterium sp. 852002-51152_SCH6134967 TaxID=1834096 RepID=UPI0007FD1BCE|nr:type II toxin-antitoxin system antitoxin SocA domain-containing protein [Mycobacterium sp. 852002-51152_SCH6134967]OBF92364.1 hypothetical protein A5790_14575 [Mycobacterium sp. 852002-51152_SCH6134967]
MTTSLDVADYILRTCPKIDASMVTRRLQKLTYYAQAWSLAWTGKGMFDEPIEAWKDGPVVRRLYSAHYRLWSVTAIPGGHAEQLTRDQAAIVDSVIAFYGALPYNDLIELTHEELPWQQARGGAPPGAHSTAEISTSSMKCYYATRNLAGLNTPHRPVLGVEDADLSVLEQTNNLQMELWQDTLDWLAVR